MKRELGHDEAFAELHAAALDALDAIERDAVLAHADGCETCRAELASLRETIAQMAYASVNAGDADARGRVKSRLMARASTGKSVRLEAAPVRRGRAQWFAMAAGILFVVSAGDLIAVMRDRASLRDVMATEVATSAHARATSDSLRAVVMSRDSVIAGVTGQDVAVVQLASNGPKPPRAMMFWDHARNGWTFVAHHMPMPATGRVYQLWLVTPTSKISAGTFMPKSDGDAMVRATYALSRDSLRAVAVTDEPMGGMPQPTGQMVVAGPMTR